MIPAIIVTALAFLFAGVTGVLALWAALLAIGFGGALVILAWQALKVVTRMTWQGFVGVLRLARYTTLAAVHVGADLARLAGLPATQSTATPRR